MKKLKKLKHEIRPEDQILYIQNASDLFECNVPVEYVTSKSGEYPLGAVEVWTWQFQVTNDWNSLKAVAHALGHGMSELSPMDDDARFYSQYGLHFPHHNNRPNYSKPCLFISESTIGYRAIWGLTTDAFQQHLHTNAALGWSIDVYQLSPDLPDGGFLIQSASSAATLMAEKTIDRWTITCSAPVQPDSDQIIGKGYFHAFQSAYQWYHWRTSNAAKK